MLHNSEQTAFNLREVRAFWNLSSFIKLYARAGGPDDPRISELCDDIRIIALHTDQPALRERCNSVLRACEAGRLLAAATL